MNNTKIVYGLLLSILLLTSACSWQGSFYKPPKHSKLAKVYFDIPKYIDIGIFANQSCKISEYGSNLKSALARAKKVDVAQVHKHIPYYLKSKIAQPKLRVLKLPAGKSIVLSMYYTTDIDSNNSGPFYSHYRYCSLSSKLTLQAGSEYIVRFNWVNGLCRQYVFDIERSNENEQFLPPAKFEILNTHCVK